MKRIVGMRLLGAVGLALTASRAGAQNIRHLTIESKADQYELVLGPNGGTVNGKPADPTAMKALLPVVSSALSNDCPAAKAKPDITVREGDKTKYIYLKSGLISDGENCLTVSGDGLLYFPIHRDFLIGQKADSITLKSPLKIFRQGVKIFELKKQGANWVSADSSILLNWDFLERFENSLKSFDIRFRALPEMGKDKEKMIVQSGDQAYEFYKIGNLSWAVKKPGSKWLEASDDWSFWYDFDNGVLEDRFAAQIRLIGDTGKDLATRRAALEKLEGWSPNVRDLYHKLLLGNEDTSLQTIALKRLHGKPSLETAKVVAQFLGKTQDEDCKKMASHILKFTNPKGPLYKPSDPAAERAKVIEFWSRWLAHNQTSL